MFAPLPAVVRRMHISIAKRMHNKPYTLLPDRDADPLDKCIDFDTLSKLRQILDGFAGGPSTKFLTPFCHSFSRRFDQFLRHNFSMY
jgi:hypothetical protein